MIILSVGYRKETFPLPCLLPFAEECRRHIFIYSTSRKKSFLTLGAKTKSNQTKTPSNCLERDETMGKDNGIFLFFSSSLLSCPSAKIGTAPTAVGLVLLVVPQGCYNEVAQPDGLKYQSNSQLWRPEAPYQGTGRPLLPLGRYIDIYCLFPASGGGEQSLAYRGITLVSASIVLGLSLHTVLLLCMCLSKYLSSSKATNHTELGILL